MPPLGQVKLLFKGVLLWQPFLRMPNVSLETSSKDTRMSHLLSCHSHLEPTQTILSEKTKKKKCKKLSLFRGLPESHCLCCWDKYIWLHCCPAGCWIWIGRMLNYSFLLEILLLCLHPLCNRELKKGLKEDLRLSGKIIISSSKTPP